MSDPDEADERDEPAGADEGDGRDADGEDPAEGGRSDQDGQADRGGGESGARDDGATATERADDLQSVVDDEVDEIRGKMAEIRDRMEEVGDELDERWNTNPDRTPDGPTDPDELVERLGKWNTSGEPDEEEGDDGAEESGDATGSDADG